MANGRIIKLLDSNSADLVIAQCLSPVYGISPLLKIGLKPRKRINGLET